MELTTRERRRLDDIEGRLIADEPHLHRALSGLSIRPLRAGRACAAIRVVARSPRSRLALAALVLGVGVALLVLGAQGGAPLVAVAGVITAQFGPWLLIRRYRTRLDRRER